ncbi:hypothetical protein PanWU01x14_257760 [Parasponia andersonii]|uniref:Uncharacterized protein n=1 Tax=Parasponia andersonii TaxID=3476 RepID=A0A2P5BA51_PARAD|nr:hypothetical protein PanWU01x14_257760 [Parasponia andersonii]
MHVKPILFILSKESQFKWEPALIITARSQLGM